MRQAGAWYRAVIVSGFCLVLSQVFSEIRNEHFSNVFGFLSQKARNLQAQYDVRPVCLFAFFSAPFPTL